MRIVHALVLAAFGLGIAAESASAIQLSANDRARVERARPRDRAEVARCLRARKRGGNKGLAGGATAGGVLGAVGGGNLVTSFDGTLASTYVGENGNGDALQPKDPYGFGKLASGSYWGAGGGISQVWAKPAYQWLVPTNSPTARTLPDVGMLVGGCPGGTILQRCPKDRSVAIIALAGGFYGVIGTSVSAPEFAGALALYVGQNGRLGNANTFLYQAAAAQAAGGPVAFHTAHPSFDGYWSDKQQGGAYDYIFGNGSPDVRVLFGFTDLPAAGNPKSPTNP